MGEVVKQDKAISMGLILELQRRYTEEIALERDEREKMELVEVWNYCIIAYAESSRGNEIFLDDLHGLNKYINTGRHEDHPCVYISLLGRF